MRPPSCGDFVDFLGTPAHANAASHLQKGATAGAPLSRELAGELAGEGSEWPVICISCLQEFDTHLLAARNCHPTPSSVAVSDR